MTKLKNTKKGMAKKALSVSLVAAMLATSNVPVWAAEDLFSDGSAAVEAPVVEEPAAEVETFSSEPAEEVAPSVEVQAATDYTVDTNMELKSCDWGTNLSLVRKESASADSADKFEVIKNDTTLDAKIVKIEIYSGDSLVKSFDGLNYIGNTALSGINNTIGQWYMGLDAYKYNRQVAVKIYVENESEAVYTFTSEIQPVDISNWTVTTTSSEAIYNGKIQSPGVSVTNTPAYSQPAKVVVKFEDAEEAKNVGTYTYYVEGVEAEGYTGEAASNSKFEITPVTANKDNLSVTISGDATYNGSSTAPTVVVTDKLTNTVIPEELYTVTVNNNKTGVGSYTKDDITVTLKDKAKIGTDTEETLNNFAAGNVDSECISGEYKVNALDLSKLGEKYTITVSPKKVGEKVQATDITVTDKATGKTVDINKTFPVSELTIITSNNTEIGTGKITIKATNVENTNIINEYSTTFAVVGNVMTNTDISFAKGTKINGKTLSAKTTVSAASSDIQAELSKVVYTGSAAEPLKEALSNLVLTNSASVNEQKLVLGTDYDIVYTDNIDSKEVSGKTSNVKLVFKGQYAGTINIGDFDIAQAEVEVTGKDVPYTAGKNSYDVEAKVVTKDASGNEVAVPEKEYTVTTTVKGNLQNKKAEGVVRFENKNYKITTSGAAKTADGYWYINISSDIVAKKLSDCTATVEGTYVFTGEAINPKLVVKDGNTTLVEGQDYEIVSKTGTNAGPAYVTIEGKGNYTGTLTVEYAIAKANLKDAEILNSADKKNYDVYYTGVPVKPDVKTVKIGNAVLKEYDPVTKTGDYTITYDEAINTGTYNFTITAVASSTKVEGSFSGTFAVKPNTLAAHFATKLGLIEVAEGTVLDVNTTGAYYTGSAITIDDFKTKYVLVSDAGKELTEGTDYRLEYEDNIDAGTAKVTAYGLGNYAAVDDDGKEIPIAAMSFTIEGKGTIDADWIKKINDVEYAGGLAVEPEVIIMDDNNNRLVQGIDFTVTTTVTDIKANDGSYAGNDIKVNGKGAYITTNEKEISGAAALTWKVVKKDMANTNITVNDQNVTVMNGTVLVPSTEYDVVFSEDGSKVTVTAKADSKYYTGSKEVSTTGAPVGQAVIKEVKVSGNKVTVILDGEADDAVGYDYVIATENDYQNGRLPNGINRNQLTTETTYQYIDQGVYYAYCHAWKRVDGEKVFGEWSNIVPFSVTAITPEKPAITSVKKSGRNVTVTWTQCDNAQGYDVVLGTEIRKVNGEMRPVEYGKAVKKVGKNTYSVTFKSCPKGATFYAGLHAWNRTSETGVKVFSPWSNNVKVTI